MRHIQDLEQLIYYYNMCLKLYKKFPNHLTHWLMNVLYNKIRALYARIPTLEQSYKMIVREKERIRQSFNPVSLCLLNRTQARKHLNMLLNERNQASSVLRSDWEHVIHNTIRELKNCKHVFCVDTHSDTWHIMK